MKYVLGLIILSVGLIMMSHTSEVSAHEADAMTSEAVFEPAAEQLCSTTVPEDVESASTASELPSCWNYDGSSCSTPGTTVRCQWQPLEPGRCFCTSDYVWTCG